jgi:hypothetical protein
MKAGEQRYEGERIGRRANASEDNANDGARKVLRFRDADERWDSQASN